MLALICSMHVMQLTAVWQAGHGCILLLYKAGGWLGILDLIDVILENKDALWTGHCHFLQDR